MLEQKIYLKISTTFFIYGKGRHRWVGDGLFQAGTYLKILSERHWLI